MTIDEFLRLEAVFRKARPSLFRLASPDPPASDAALAGVEAALSCKLPQAYRDFLKNVGGGDYPLFSVFSAHASSNEYLPRQVARARGHVPKDLLPVHDDQAGGYYVLRIIGDRADDPVYYFDWETKTISTKKYDSIIDAVADNAFGTLPPT